MTQGTSFGYSPSNFWIGAKAEVVAFTEKRMTVLVAQVARAQKELASDAVGNVLAEAGEGIARAKRKPAAGKKQHTREKEEKEQKRKEQKQDE